MFGLPHVSQRHTFASWLRTWYARAPRTFRAVFSASESLLRIHGLTGRTVLDFMVDGQFMPNHDYTAVDLKTFEAFSADTALTVRLVGGKQVAGSTVTLTLTDAAPDPYMCPSGGTRSPRHGTVDAVF